MVGQATPSPNFEAHDSIYEFRIQCRHDCNKSHGLCIVSATRDAAYISRQRQETKTIEKKIDSN